MSTGADMGLMAGYQQPQQRQTPELTGFGGRDYGGGAGQPMPVPESEWPSAYPGGYQSQ